MPTLLTNRRMDPALAARIETSVRGKGPKAARGIYSRAAVVLFRGAMAFLAFVVIGGTFFLLRRDARQLETARQALLQTIDAEARTLSTSTASFSLAGPKGWAIGGGIEVDVSRKITLGMEYRHINFDTTSNAALPVKFDTSENQARISLGYRLN